MKQKSASAMALIASSLVATGAHAGTLFTMLNISGKEQQTSRLLIGQGSYRLETKNGKNKSVEIFDEGKLYLLNSNDDTYTVIDSEKLAKKAAEYRKQTEPGPKPVRELKITGGVDTLATKFCIIWEVYVDGILKQELCVAPFKTLGNGYFILQTMNRYNELLAGFDSATPSLPWTDVETTGGIPIRVRNFAIKKDPEKKDDSGQLELVNASGLTLINEAEVITADTFRVPPGMTENKEKF